MKTTFNFSRERFYAAYLEFLRRNPEAFFSQFREAVTYLIWSSSFQRLPDDVQEDARSHVVLQWLERQGNLRERAFAGQDELYWYFLRVSRVLAADYLKSYWLDRRDCAAATALLPSTVPPESVIVRLLDGEAEFIRDYVKKHNRFTGDRGERVLVFLHQAPNECSDPESRVLRDYVMVVARLGLRAYREA